MRLKRFSRPLLLLFLTLAGLAYYEQRQQRPAQTPRYLTETVQRGNIAQTVLATGSVQALKEVKVGALVSGEVSHLAVQLGDEVRKGQLLATIDARSQHNEQQSALASLSASQAQLSAANAKRQEAEKHYQRVQGLRQSGAESQQNLDNAKSALEQAKSALEQATAEVRRHEIALENSKIALGHTQVLAPLDGVVIAVAVEEGQNIHALQNSPTLVTIAQTHTMRLKAEIAEADVNKIRVGMPAEFTLLGNPQKRFHSTIASLDPAPTAISNNSNSNESAVYYYARLLHDNADGLLRIGMTATITITTAEARDVLTIPLAALHSDAKGDHVQVLENGQVRRQAVQIGLDDGVRVEITEGLRLGEEIVLSQGSDTPNLPNHRGPRLF